MSLVLNTNLSSMVAQSSLTASGGQLATALQQLSSGMRINTAADGRRRLRHRPGHDLTDQRHQPGRAQRQ